MELRKPSLLEVLSFAVVGATAAIIVMAGKRSKDGPDDPELEKNEEEEEEELLQHAASCEPAAHVEPIVIEPVHSYSNFQQASLLNRLPQELLARTLILLDCRSLSHLERACSVLARMDNDKLWHGLLRERLATQSTRFGRMAQRSGLPDELRDLPWKAVARHHHIDSRRQLLRREELLGVGPAGSGLGPGPGRWLFNFKSQAGGNERTVQEALFRADGLLHLRGYPPLPWALVDHKCELCKQPATLRCSQCRLMWYCSKTCQREAWKQHKASCGSEAATPTPGGESQVLQISHFPDHHVGRLPDGEWRIQNENICLVSCYTDQDLTPIFGNEIASDFESFEDEQAYLHRLAAVVQECSSLNLLLSGESQIKVHQHVRARAKGLQP